METIYGIIAVLVCILLLLVIGLYLVFAYQIYRVKKRADVFISRKNREAIINKKIDKLIK